MDKHTDNIDSLPDLNLGIWIALAAGLGLFMELMVIRIHSSYFQLFAYFKNVSLLSCFLGLGIGYARGSLRPLTTPLVLPFIAFQIIFLYLLRFTDVNALSMNPITEQHAFGIFQSGGVINSSFTYFFLATTFAFNALCFLPLGQLASRLMMRKNKLAAYSWNLIGSLLGIILFFIISFTNSMYYTHLFVTEILTTNNKQFVLGFFFFFGRLMSVNNLSTNCQQKKADNNSYFSKSYHLST